MYNVTAKRWEHGWELHIDGIGVTQSRLLSGAEAMVRDYLSADDLSDAETAEVTIYPDLDGQQRATAVYMTTRSRDVSDTSRSSLASQRLLFWW